jgi:hypothetical protein
VVSDGTGALLPSLLGQQSYTLTLTQLTSAALAAPLPPSTEADQCKTQGWLLLRNTTA